MTTQLTYSNYTQSTLSPKVAGALKFPKTEAMFTKTKL